MKRFLLLIALIAALFTTLLGPGCTSPDAQRVAFMATDATGQAVNDAEKAFVAFERAKGQQALGVAATPQQVSDWVRADSTWKQYVPLVDKYNAAYTAWSGANAAAAGGTADPQFHANVVAAAVELTTFVAQFVPAVKPLKAQ